ncbi:MAG: Gfo/Idh/MocA family protein [Gaiellaceae bacterium]
MRVALVGAGVIAQRYVARIAEVTGLELAGATDVLPARAAALVAEHGGREYRSLDEALADDAVDVVVNLTPASSHVAVTRAALDAGKHVHTEKPVALTGAEARKLATLASERGVRLSCAPATLLGEAQQTAWKVVRDGRLGTVRAVYAEANWGRIERWHPSPDSLYEVGPLVDVGIYPLTILTAIFGPVRRVTAYAKTLQQERTRTDGTTFTLPTPDLYVATLDLADGVAVRLTASYWVGPDRQRGIEFHGDDASLWMPTWAESDSRLLLTTNGEDETPVQPLREPYHGIDWAAPLLDLADAVGRNRPHRMGAEHAAHVVDVFEAIEASAAGAGAVAVVSDFPRPDPLDWAS